jgi:hypothetical protein
VRRLIAATAAALAVLATQVSALAVPAPIDVSISAHKDGPYVNAGQDADGSDQRVTRKIVFGGSTSFWIRFKNKNHDPVSIEASGDSSPDYTVKYFRGDTDVTSSFGTVCGTTFEVPGDGKILVRMKVKGITAPVGTSETFEVGTRDACGPYPDLALARVNVI